MDSDRAMLWTVAVAASLGLHALVIVALLGFGAFTGSSSPSSSQEPPAKPAAVASDSGTVPSETPPASPVDSGAVPSAVAGTVPSEDKYYIVRSGDNLSKIAKLDDSSLSELAELNGKSIKELSKLMVGQKIKVKNGIK